MTVKSTSLASTMLAFALFVAAAGAEEIASPLTPFRDKTQHYEKAIYSNSALAPVTVKVNGTFENSKLSQSMPYVFVVPARGKTEAFNAKAKDPRAYFSFQTTEEYRFGDYRVATANRPLQLPFAAGQAHEVLASSGAGVDFAMPEGTPVIAVKEGLVVAVESAFKSGGEDEKFRTRTNYVEVAHPDGTVGRYTHLQSVAVQPGRSVQAGDSLGLSGKVGYAKQPLLHFELNVPTRELRTRGLAAMFVVNGSPAALQAGTKAQR